MYSDITVQITLHTDSIKGGTNEERQFKYGHERIKKRLILVCQPYQHTFAVYFYFDVLIIDVFSLFIYSFHYYWYEFDQKMF